MNVSIKSLSIFFPAYNDAQSIPRLIKKADATARKITSDYELIVVNDGSADNTQEVLEKLKRKYRRLKIVRHGKNKGYGGALISGFRSSTKEWVFYTDGDGQYDPTELLKLAKKVGPTVDVVNGYKKGRSDAKHRVFLGSLYNKLLHHIYPIPISDIDCDFRLIRNKCMKKIHLNSQSGHICLELVTKLARIGAHFADIPVTHYERKYGRSEFFRVPHLIKTLQDHALFFFQTRLGRSTG